MGSLNVWTKVILSHVCVRATVCAGRSCACAYVCVRARVCCSRDIQKDRVNSLNFERYKTFQQTSMLINFIINISICLRDSFLCDVTACQCLA